ncbi:hypothetical protein JOC77_002544 [Peribacillus deserti]|uniref:Uncharacterized protein n=1 Tax=Peribacillus deserti TaxID=673318 RepID=A0ABS2QJD5_9BACI|nr:hypothetical protein [Peribacillus deserti]MBM7693105.1 hypothetical protein [Peribacillus deserti]
MMGYGGSGTIDGIILSRIVKNLIIDGFDDDFNLYAACFGEPEAIRLEKMT